MRSLVLILFSALIVLGSITLIAVPSRADNANPLHFFGNAVTGWGLTSSTITKPGPTLHYNKTTLQIALHSMDSQSHTFFVDYNDDSVPSTGEPTSGTFNNPGFNWFNLTLGQDGQFTYRCSFHPTTMFGTIIIGNPSGGGGLSLTLIIAIVVVIIVVAAVVGIVLMRRRPKTPPETPPRT